MPSSGWPATCSGATLLRGDAEFSRRIRESSPWCEHCHTTYPPELLECAHIYGRRSRVLRHDDDNALALCRECHRWAHDHPEEFGAWFMEVFPERVTKLAAKAGYLLKWML